VVFSVNQCRRQNSVALARHVSGANQADDCELLMGTSRCPSTGRTPLGRQRTFRPSPTTCCKLKKSEIFRLYWQGVGRGRP
jgi:hypothetical protein